MGLFGKKKNEEGYIISADTDNSRYSEWVEQARQARNPEELTPEQLLGNITVVNQEDENDDFVLDSADAFKGKTSISLYERMLNFLSEDTDDEEEEEEIVEKASVKEPKKEEAAAEEAEEATEAPKSTYDPSKDAFADFFRSLEQESAPTKTAEYRESDEAYSNTVINDEPVKEESVDDLLSRMFGTSKVTSAPKVDKVDKKEEKPTVEEIITEVKAKEETIVLPEIKEDIKVAKEEEDIKVVAQEQTILTQEDEVEESIEKTRFIELPSEHHTPKHSLYGNDQIINRKAIDDFFDNNFDDEVLDEMPEPKRRTWGRKAKIEEEIIEEPEAEESVTDVFNDDIDDYERLDDAARLKSELLKKRRTLATKMIISIVLTVLMAVINGAFLSARGLDLGNLPDIANLILLVITMAVNITSFAPLFKGEITSDLCANATGIIILIQSLVSIFAFDGKGAGLGVLAGIAYSVSLVAKRAVCSATLKSLCIIATNEPKHAVTIIDDDNEAKEIAGNLFEDEEHCLCYSKKAINVKGFIKNWSRRTPNDKNSLISFVIALGLAIVVTLIAFLLVTPDVANLLSIFAISFSLVLAPSMYLPYSLPAKVMTDGLKYYDSAIGGWNAATALAKSNCVAIKASDLFPAGSIVLHKMNPLSANPIDTSIAKAAALTIKAESPLANIFKDIIRDQVGNLPKVEDVKYENKLGLSGWVGDERILIGNRTLLENHNVKTPSLDSERAILSAGYYPVYLAVGGVPCLLFVVQYVADPNVSYELLRLCNAGATVVVNSTDPNITKNMICTLFDLYEECIEMIGRNGLNKLREKSVPQESVNGFAAYKDNASGFLAIVSSAIRISGIKTMMQVIHIIGIIATLAAFIVLLYAKGFIAATVLLAAIFQVVFVCITASIPYINRP